MSPEGKGTVVAVQNAESDAGVADVTTCPSPSTATQSEADGHETSRPGWPSSLSHRGLLQVGESEAGFVETVAYPLGPPSATHRSVPAHDRLNVCELLPYGRRRSRWTGAFQVRGAAAAGPAEQTRKAVATSKSRRITASLSQGDRRRNYRTGAPSRRGPLGIGPSGERETAQVSGFPRTGPTVVPPWYRLIRPMRPDRPDPWTHWTFWTLTDASTPSASRLGAERSLVQIRSPRLTRARSGSGPQTLEPGRQRSQVNGVPVLLSADDALFPAERGRAAAEGASRRRGASCASASSCAGP